MKCENGDKPASVGDVFSVKTPAKAADIVFLIDTTKKSEVVYKDYIQPLIQQLSNELHSKGISDVEYHIIGFGGENQWPAHITSNGKLTFSGKAPNLKFGDGPKEEPLHVGCPKVDHFLNLVRDVGKDALLALGLDLQARTYTEGLRYPFRAHAIKGVVAVTGNPCQIGRFYPVSIC